MTELERIDLTQLEWMISDYRKKAEEILNYAIAMVPELIAELKRCYEEIDKLNRALSAINAVHFPKR